MHAAAAGKNQVVGFATLLGSSISSGEDSQSEDSVLNTHAYNMTRAIGFDFDFEWGLFAKCKHQPLWNGRRK
eukprot:2593763-Amphidinium_carterae.1